MFLKYLRGEGSGSSEAEEEKKYTRLHFKFRTDF